MTLPPPPSGGYSFIKGVFWGLVFIIIVLISFKAGAS